MKFNPIKKTKIVEYWDCGNKKHNHRHEKFAISCMERAPNKKALEELKTIGRIRKIYIAKEVINGRTYSDVAREIGVTVERVRQLFCGVLREADKQGFYADYGYNYSYNLKEIRELKELNSNIINEVSKFWNVHLKGSII